MICVVEDDPNIREIEVYAMKDLSLYTHLTLPTT